MSPTSGQTLVYDGNNNIWFNATPPTYVQHAQNVGVAGYGVFAYQDNETLNFKNVASGSANTNVNENNYTIYISVNEGALHITESQITDLDHDAQKIKGKVVDDSSISDGYVLAYDSASDSIIYKQVSGAGASQLSDLSDVSNVVYTDGYVLRANGSQYVSAQLKGSDLDNDEGWISDLSSFTTDDLAEGSTNRYYSTSLFNNDWNTKKLEDISDVDTTGISDGYILKWDAANSKWVVGAESGGGSSTFTGLTDTPGSYSSYGGYLVRVNSGETALEFLENTTDNIPEGSTNLYWTQTRFDTAFGNKTTDDLTEGSTNLYYTNARFDSRFSTKNLGDLNDVDTSSQADGYVLTYNGTSGKWEAQASSGSTPGGSNGQVQYNNNNSFGGAELYWDDVNNRLGINESSPAYTLDVSGTVNLHGEVKITRTGGDTTTIIGVDAAASASSSLSDATIIGYKAGNLVTGNNNTFVGVFSGRNVTSGQWNVAVGSNSLEAYEGTCSGSYNTAVGYTAGRRITSGSRNVAIGYSALSNVLGGAGNVAVGPQTLHSEDSHDYSIGVGYQAGYGSKGDYNIYIGYLAGFGSTGGGTRKNNICIGKSAGQSLITGSFNVCIGYEAGIKTGDGTENIFIGRESGPQSSTGVTSALQKNVAIGHFAGSALTTGYDNVLLGTNAGDAITTGYRNIVIGYNADLAAGDTQKMNIGNTLYGDLANKYIGIGTSSPSYALDVSGDIHCTGKLTSDGGNDPAYVLYNYETRTSVRNRVIEEVAPDKLNGAVLFFNGETGKLEIFVPSTGEYKDLQGNVLGTSDPITATFETVTKYYLDRNTGQIKSIQKKVYTTRYRIKDGYYLDEDTGKLYKKVEDGDDIEVTSDEAIETY